MTKLQHTNIMEVLGEIHLKMSNFEKDAEYLKCDIKEIKEWMKERDDKSDKRYAPRWIMYPIISTGSLMLAAIIGALMGLILVPSTRAIALFYINLFA